MPRSRRRKGAQVEVMNRTAPPTSSTRKRRHVKCWIQQERRGVNAEYEGTGQVTAADGVAHSRADDFSTEKALNPRP
jgi:hypothetical protein